MLGGMVAGATGAAMHGGNLMAVVQGAFMGALGGLVAGAAFLGGVPWPVMAGAGAAFAVGTGGVKGLESFAAGFAGGLAGGALGSYLNPPASSSAAAATTDPGYQTNMSQNEAQSDVERFYASAEPASQTTIEWCDNTGCHQVTVDNSPNLDPQLKDPVIRQPDPVTPEPDCDWHMAYYVRADQFFQTCTCFWQYYYGLNCSSISSGNLTSTVGVMTADGCQCDKPPPIRQ